MENGYIVTGHHTNDYIETLLINLIRGGGYSSLGTLPVYRDNIFRPMMIFTESEIETILKEEKWKVFEDESNESEEFLRNRIRKNILPLLKKEGLNPGKVYENFHTNTESLFDENQKLMSSKIPSFLKIDSLTLNKISLEDLKHILDSHARIIKTHPFNKSILIEIKKELEKETSFLIENNEVLTWKSKSSDLFLIPQNSIALKKARLENSNNSIKLSWNGHTIEIAIGHELGYWTKGLEILKNGRHREISELLREKQIPLPVREFLPILFKENKASVILFSLWDDRLKDFIGD